MLHLRHLKYLNRCRLFVHDGILWSFVFFPQLKQKEGREEGRNVNNRLCSTFVVHLTVERENEEFRWPKERNGSNYRQVNAQGPVERRNCLRRGNFRWEFNRAVKFTPAHCRFFYSVEHSTVVFTWQYAFLTYFLASFGFILEVFNYVINCSSFQVLGFLLQ